MARASIRWAPALLLALFAVVGVAALFTRASATLPASLWLTALAGPAADDVRQAVFALSLAPRAAVALMAGAALGLGGALCQQALRNPLAEPSVLGVSAGAQLGIVFATLYAPGLLMFGADVPALVGAALAVGVALLVAARARSAPVAVTLGGLIFGLFCASLTALLVILHRDYLTDLLLWQAGALDQTGWSVAAGLVPRLALGALAAALLARPLGLLDLPDDSARSAGARVATVRIIAFALAAALAASVTASVGVIGFVGLAAPHIARFAGARRFAGRLVLSAIVGAVLLFSTDQLLQATPGLGFLPTGAMTTLAGAPLLLWLMRRLQTSRGAPGGQDAATARRSPFWLVPALPVLALLMLAALQFGRSETGWEWLQPGAGLASELRWPRVLGAAAAGALAALSGYVLQTLFRNPMASPELLGVAQGAGVGLVALAVAAPAAGGLAPPIAAALGAAGALGLLALVTRGGTAAPDRVLLAGAALGALLAGLATLLLTLAGPRAIALLNWMSGSTFLVTGASARIAFCAAAATLLLCALARRDLALLALGDVAAAALGQTPGRARARLLALAALAAGVSTMIVGPLSFIGLIGPRMARLAGFGAGAAGALASAVIGAALLVGADWIGRNAAYPWPLPAGLIAALIGAPAALALLVGRGRRAPG
ncbi:Fe3+-hydroxamate ABC transporter permease FhuB [Methylopila jiangsuensis]|uniref:Fe3+-hydroxamate ABC transporter permease FhuB n=1 Tax=Methylopila jiangsuensis TaxID=586230 RepID=A0A9W6JF43_9HYPH|nr:Fe(3+)-hydroxamate ABC transporter permease FhuB [Methylopila jiangsuensis]MDR6286304.1 iron complex transport system permease protein [Methylopila jiangsuensis]GLK76067.1 Fe3+-hydroxamate ABC transporter permease FhuB [Methylopila jiangsuensis]